MVVQAAIELAAARRTGSRVAGVAVAGEAVAVSVRHQLEAARATE
jgi:hypothetical protein